MKKEDIIFEVLDQIREDVESGESDSLFSLLLALDNKNLITFLPKARREFLKAQA